MKFLDGLIGKYNELGLETPKWVNEYNAVPTAGSVGAIPSVALIPAAPTATSTTKTSVVDTLMKAVQDAGLDKDPDVNKIKTAITQKVADAKKEVINRGTKLVDTIDKTLSTIKSIPSELKTP